jgi:hypothetical protein
MADALASGASVRKDVGVQVPPRALSELARDREPRNYLIVQSRLWYRRVGPTVICRSYSLFVVMTLRF